jgi:hypothetical protein
MADRREVSMQHCHSSPLKTYVRKNALRLSWESATAVETESGYRLPTITPQGGDQADPVTAMKADASSSK